MSWKISKKKDGFYIIRKSDGYTVGPYSSAHTALLFAEDDDGVDKRSLGMMLSHGLPRILYEKIMKNESLI